MAADDKHAHPLRIAEEFSQGLSLIWSDRVLGQIRHLLELLATMPEIGSENVRPALKVRYGERIRKLPVSKFIIIYRFDGSTIDVLALVYGPGVD